MSSDATDYKALSDWLQVENARLLAEGSRMNAALKRHATDYAGMADSANALYAQLQQATKVVEAARLLQPTDEGPVNVHQINTVYHAVKEYGEAAKAGKERGRLFATRAEVEAKLKEILDITRNEMTASSRCNRIHTIVEGLLKSIGEPK